MISKLIKMMVSVCVFGLFGCAANPPVKQTIVFPPPPDKARLEWIGTFHSERDFEKSSKQKLVEAVAGEGEVDAFDGPFGVAVNVNGQILVSDLYHQVVKVMNMGNAEITPFGALRFRNNLGITTDSQGRVYVADGKAQKIMVLSAEGEPLHAIGNGETLEKPAYLAVNNALGRLYVSDPKAYAVKVFSLEGEFLFEFGDKGGEDGQFNAPQGLAIDKDDQVYVADMLNARIQVFSAEGEFIRKFGSRGYLKRQFETPKDLAFDSEGHLYVVDSRRPNFRIFNPDGTLLLVVGGEKRTDHRLGFALPVSVHVDEQDRVFIVDLMNRRVAVWQYLSAAYLARQKVLQDAAQ